MQQLLHDPHVMEAIGWLVLLLCPLEFGEVSYQPYVHECLLVVAKNQQWVNPNVTKLATRKPRVYRHPLEALRNIRAQVEGAPRLEALAPFAYIRHAEAVRLREQAKAYHEYWLSQTLAYQKWMYTNRHHLPWWMNWLVRLGFREVERTGGQARQNHAMWYHLAIASDPRARYYDRRGSIWQLERGLGEEKFLRGIMPNPGALPGREGAQAAPVR